MKYLLFVLLLVAILVTAGCVRGGQISNQTPTVQPTPTPTPDTAADAASAAAEAADAASEKAKYDAAFHPKQTNEQIAIQTYTSRTYTPESYHLPIRNEQSTFTIDGDYCGSMVQVGGQNTMCFHLSSSGSVEWWVQHTRGGGSSQSSYTKNNNRLIINVPNGWHMTGWSAKTGTETSQIMECVFIDSDGSLSCNGKSYWRALPDQL